MIRKPAGLVPFAKYRAAHHPVYNIMIGYCLCTSTSPACSNTTSYIGWKAVVVGYCKAILVGLSIRVELFQNILLLMMMITMRRIIVFCFGMVQLKSNDNLCH